MSRFELLTNYIPVIPTDAIGEWFIDKANDGSPSRMAAY